MRNSGPERARKRPHKKWKWEMTYAHSVQLNAGEKSRRVLWGHVSDERRRRPSVPWVDSNWFRLTIEISNGYRCKEFTFESTNEKLLMKNAWANEPLNRAVTAADDEANEIKNALYLYVSESRWNFETVTARRLRVSVGQFCIEFAAKATLRHRVKLQTKSTRLPNPFGTKRLRPKRSEMEHMNKRENMCRQGLWLWNDRKSICSPHFIRKLIYF